MTAASLKRRVRALEPAGSTDWSDFLDTLSDPELDRLEAIMRKLPTDTGAAEKSEAQLVEHFSVLDAEEQAYLDDIVRKGLSNAWAA